MNEYEQLLKDLTQQDFAYLVSRRAKRKQEPSRIHTLHYFHIAHVDDFPILSFFVEYNDGTYENVPFDIQEQKIIDHNIVMEYYCHDCRKDTMMNIPYDRFMVHNSLWEKYGTGKHCLCLHCFQLRLERDLTIDDFIDHSSNSINRLVKQLKAKAKL